MARKYQTITVRLVFDDRYCGGTEVDAIIELFEPYDISPEAMVPVSVKVSKPRPYRGRNPWNGKSPWSK